MSDAHDDWLMVAVQRGDVDHLGVLFERYHRPLFAFFARMTRDRVVSEDLVQEVFLRVLRFRQTYRPGSQFRTWLYQIARNLCHDRLRGSEREAPIDEMHEVIMPVQPEDDALDRSQQARLLRQALADLPPARREVLVLSRFQDLKYEQVAAVLGCEVGAVKVRVHRALKELRQRYLTLIEKRTTWTATS